MLQMLVFIYMIMDIKKILAALKSALTLEIKDSDASCYFVDCTYETMIEKLNTLTVQAALVGSEICINRCESWFAIEYKNQPVGQLYTKDKHPKKVN
jgi:hypothetical protein